MTRVLLGGLALVALGAVAFVLDARRIAASQGLSGTAEPSLGDSVAVFGMPTVARWTGTGRPAEAGTDWDAWFREHDHAIPDWRN